MADISSDVIRGYNDTMILCILSKSPSYGYEISKSIRTITEDQYVIKETTLYSAFSRLEKNGFLESYIATPDETGASKKRTYYRITDSGKEYYQDKCDEFKLIQDIVSKFVQ